MDDPAGARPAWGPAAAAETDPGTHAPPAAVPTPAHWDRFRRLSSVHRTIEEFLGDHPQERGAWLVAGYAGGIALWMALAGPWQWAAILALCGAVGFAAALIAARGSLPWLALALGGMALAVAAGMGTIWLRADLAGTPPLAQSLAADVTARIVAREPGTAGARLVIALVPPGQVRAIRAYLPLPWTSDAAVLGPGAVLRARMRLAPPAEPIVPGAHDFAFDAWFAGIGATAAIEGPITVLTPAPAAHLAWRDALASRIATRIGGSAGRIGAILVTGPHRGLDAADAQAMRDAGFAHLLVIGGLHVGMVIGTVYLLVLRGLALLPWLALRVRLPVVAALAGALAGIGYGVMTGGGVPTTRAVVVANPT